MRQRGYETLSYETTRSFLLYPCVLVPLSTKRIIEMEQPTEAFLRGIDIHELLPQQKPFVMIGRLIHFDPVRTVTETVVAADNLFTDADTAQFSASGLVENVAQTCAARIGYYNKYIVHKDVQIGFIGAVRGFDILRLPRVGETLTTTVNVDEEVFGMILAHATVEVGDELIARTEMKIAIKEQ